MSTENLYQRVINVFRKTGSVKKTAEIEGVKRNIECSMYLYMYYHKIK